MEGIHRSLQASFQELHHQYQRLRVEDPVMVHSSITDVTDSFRLLEQLDADFARVKSIQAKSGAGSVTWKTLHGKSTNSSLGTPDHGNDRR